MGGWRVRDHRCEWNVLGADRSGLDVVRGLAGFILLFAIVGGASGVLVGPDDVATGGQGVGTRRAVYVEDRVVLLSVRGFVG